MKIELKSKNLKQDLERVADVLSVCLNNGLTESIMFDLQRKEHHLRNALWMYQNNGSCSDFSKFTRIDLIPSCNNYWMNIISRNEESIIFKLNFRYSKDTTIYTNLILELFKDKLTGICEEND